MLNVITILSFFMLWLYNPWCNSPPNYKKTTELGINLQRSDVQSKLLRSPLESVPLCCNFALSGLLYILNRNYWHFACERCCVRYFLPPELIKTLKCSYYPGIWFLLFLNYASDIFVQPRSRWIWSITVFFLQNHRLLMLSASSPTHYMYIIGNWHILQW